MKYLRIRIVFCVTPTLREPYAARTRRCIIEGVLMPDGMEIPDQGFRIAARRFEEEALWTWTPSSTLRPQTVMDLAARNGVGLPATDPEKFHQFSDFYDFIARLEVIGIGMDCAEFKGPPDLFQHAYALARSAGLRRTAHVPGFRDGRSADVRNRHRHHLCHDGAGSVAGHARGRNHVPAPSMRHGFPTRKNRP
ncbi:hypothetical protein ACLRDC_09950 [Gluconacetobacter sacchari]|uniref:hypothetical protein n=1 Tax=Gluconacetobacter sacchari TaxID=92759 RepID=UPI0039B6D365